MTQQEELVQQLREFGDLCHSPLKQTPPSDRGITAFPCAGTLCHDAADHIERLSRQVASYEDGHLCHPDGRWTSDGGGVCAHCGCTLHASDSADRGGQDWLAEPLPEPEPQPQPQPEPVPGDLAARVTALEARVAQFDAVIRALRGLAS